MYFWSVFKVFSPNTEKCGPEKTSYLDVFQAVMLTMVDTLYLPAHN